MAGTGQDTRAAGAARRVLGLTLALALGAAWAPLRAGSAPLTPAQQQVMRQYQAAELARQNCQTYMRIAKPAPGERKGQIYHLERSPAKMAEAVALYTELLEQARAAFGPGDPQTAVIAGSFARLYADQGSRLDLAEAMYRQCLDIRQKALGPDSPEAADAWFDLGVFYHETGRFNEAEQCLKDCLEIRMHRPGPQAALAQRALGLLYRDLGDYARAEALFQEALAIQKGPPGSGPVEVARTLTLLAGLSVKQGDLARCAALAQEAVRLTDPPSAATSGDRFAARMLVTITQIAQGHLHEAVAYMYQFFFTMLEKKEWAGYLRALNDDAYPAIIAKRNFISRGMEPALNEAERQTRETFGDHHPQMASAMANTAFLQIVLRHWDQAVPACVQANEINFQILPSVFAMASEGQKLKYVEKTEGYRDLLLSAVVGAKAGGADVPVALKWAMRMKGIVLDSMVGEREVLRKGLDPELRTTYEQLRQARQELSSLYIKGPEADLAAFNARMGDLAGRIDGLESRLSQGSAAFKETREMFSVTPEAVRARMPRGSALVEYFEFNNYAEKGNPPWMVAFVLDAEGQVPPRMVDLGPAAPVEQAIAEWRRELHGAVTGRSLEDARRRLDDRGRKVGALVWDPVAAGGDLARKRVVYLAPDGPLHLMPFAALPAGAGYLIEQVNLACVSTGKDFLRIQRPGSRAGALLVGGVDFNSSLPSLAAAPATRARGQRARLNDLEWNPLPGTAEEVDAIAAAMAGAGLPATLLKGGQAQKGSVSAGFQSARYIHLATHGFFLGDEVGLDPGSRGLAVVGNRPAEDPPPGEGLKAAPAFHQVNPLLLSGLALAGANHSGAGGWSGDGYLLAMDVANLDLDGVDLVTLSACETGLGEIKRGEGVFGLQRSFVLAGADALVMSLWSVPDQETRDLMVDFYRQVLAGGSKRDGFRQSQLRMLKARPHPFYWAAFQYQGVE